MAKKESKRRIPKSALELAEYEKLDAEWRSIGLSGPSRIALVDAKLFRISDLRKISLKELEGLDGMSKSAIARLKTIMEAKKINFR